MSHWQPDDDFDDEDAAGDENAANYGGRDAHIYLIDADKSITGNADRFDECLQCIEQDMLRAFSKSARDLVAVVFYNTEKSPVPYDAAENEDAVDVNVSENCAILMSLKPLSKQSISYFRSFKNSDDFFDFPTKYGTNTNGKFAEALWLCSRMFIRCNYKLRNSTIVLFTNNEQPNMPGSVELQQTMSRASDLMQNNVEVWLVPMVDAFDYDLFYKEFLCRVDGEDLDAFKAFVPESRRQMLRNRIFRRNLRNKCLRHLNFTLGEGLVIGCDLTSFVQLAKKPAAIKMFSDSNEIVVAKRSYVTAVVNPETHETEPPHKLLPDELFKCQEICGQEVIFSGEELTTIRTLVPPGLRLLGFKPIDTLTPRCFVKCCAFLVHSDSVIKGSSKLFRALWEKCLEKEKYALCTLTYRRKVAPRYVALVPQNDDIHGRNGFRLVYVPMETDYNHLDVLDVEPPPVSEEQVEMFKNLCKKLRFPYQPDYFSNPSLEKFFSEMEALAFDDPAPEPCDNTLPELDTQDEKIGEIVAEIKDAFGSDPAAAAKRPNASAANGGPSKSAKTEHSMTDIESAVKDGRGNSCTVQNLKDFIKSKGRTFSSNAVKKNLVELAEQIVNQ